jgi:hypothetical protein
MAQITFPQLRDQDSIVTVTVDVRRKSQFELGRKPVRETPRADELVRRIREFLGESPLEH